jgi:hypothetical protein
MFDQNTDMETKKSNCIHFPQPSLIVLRKFEVKRVGLSVHAASNWTETGCQEML